MAQFVTRVELLNASSDDYEKLHGEMKKRFFERNISGDDGKTYTLPTATYSIDSSLPIEEVRNSAVSAAAETGKVAWVITSGSTLSWSLPIEQ
ncbi:type V toxin-antitoxin system endoribonuclease antitoxin GhoS [Burkholderia gladioli]|uniref:DUF2622 domain-containing protein n=1 Tax=Burkholderia phage BgManors32 TaxID=2894335 RepID=A0AAE8YEZ8_9CAUD|nr:type V toxin-antitoxin system endoribonuclease antitoxin GhoS [Burkholderia gladioli]YP_010668247.1 hypothetical protein PQC05_gp81 [Burkholderia phage BgManors32]UEW68645.1 hypothetical protein [Burkholderia phage BgManors32]